ncbi:MAG: hypothetical protein WD576_01155 [Nitriliruptoraceae bacterium]
MPLNHELAGAHMAMEVRSLELDRHLDLLLAHVPQAVERMWQRDYTLWQQEPTEVADRLGWLDAGDRLPADVAMMERNGEQLLASSATDVVLVGMGGSSLYPEVLSKLSDLPYRSSMTQRRLHVLDSTDPAAVRRIVDQLDWSQTLLVASSKSGSTLETRCHLATLTEHLRQIHGDAAHRFVSVVTDPDSPLESHARAQGIAVVAGQSDVGGRYSALTPFGMWPAMLMGLDLEAHFAPAREMLALAALSDAGANESAALGALLAAGVQSGNDKLTLELPGGLSVFGAWVEQLVAESTGKHGQGLVPVLGESVSSPHLGADRLLVAFTADNGASARSNRASDVGANGDVPGVFIDWDDPRRVAAEVVRWEVATAIAGALLGINPFDQPDVTRAKEATQRALDEHTPLPPTDDPASCLNTAKPGDYIALLGFVAPESDNHRALEAAAERLRAEYQVPVTVGIGPRYLHSTGQLHKGGANNGIYLVVVGDDPVDVEVAGEQFTFSQVKRAQAVGDIIALREAGRRVAHVDVETVADLV